MWGQPVCFMKDFWMKGSAHIFIFLISSQFQVFILDLKTPILNYILLRFIYYARCLYNLPCMLSQALIQQDHISHQLVLMILISYEICLAAYSKMCQVITAPYLAMTNHMRFLLSETVKCFIMQIRFVIQIMHQGTGTV